MSYAYSYGEPVVYRATPVVYRATVFDDPYIFGYWLGVVFMVAMLGAWESQKKKAEEEKRHEEARRQAEQQTVLQQQLLALQTQQSGATGTPQGASDTTPGPLHPVPGAYGAGAYGAVYPVPPLDVDVGVSRAHPSAAGQQSVQNGKFDDIPCPWGKTCLTAALCEFLVVRWNWQESGPSTAERMAFWRDLFVVRTFVVILDIGIFAFGEETGWVVFSACMKFLMFLSRLAVLRNQREALGKELGLERENSCRVCCCYLFCSPCFLANEARTIKWLKQKGRIVGAPLKGCEAA